MDSAALQHLMDDQAHLVSRRQELAIGGDDNFIQRQLRRREWARVHTGVFIGHTGALSWAERAWAALLLYDPAALSHESALQAHGVRSAATRPTGGFVAQPSPLAAIDREGWSHDLIHIAVAKERRVQRLPGVRLHRVGNLSAVIAATSPPPRVNLERALLDVASTARRDSDAVAVLGDACQCRRTTPERLREALGPRTRLPRRGFLMQVLDDVAEGVYSVLEYRYLTRVERPHGLPTASRQRRVRLGRTIAYRDVEYQELHTVVELDGRLGHEATLDRWDDMERDVASATSGDTTLRIGWRHLDDPCRTALAVARALVAQGWAGRLEPCSPSCRVNADSGVFSAPGA